MDIHQITDVMKKVAAQEILPRFKRLKNTDIQTKSSPTDMVTIADIETEKSLSSHLKEIFPAAIIGGEESIADNPELENKILNADIGFLIDPIDGTNNFIKGNERFAMMLVALEKGKTIASWIYLPLFDKMAVAEKGKGCYIEGQKITMSSDIIPTSDLRGACHTKRMQPDLQNTVNANLSKIKENCPAYCAGYDYICLLEGKIDFSVYGNTLPWDHLPGAFMVNQAGGTAQQLDGQDYSALRQGNGILSTSNNAMWQKIQKNIIHS